MTRIPTLEESLEKMWKGAKSEHPLRLLGHSKESGEVVISEETRANHIHILGTTREGKSKFLEKFLRQDIDQGYGATLLDPSDNGQTCYDVLRYCISKGFKRVCLIDPHDLIIPALNPLAYKGPAAIDSIVSSLMESIRLLWGQAGFESTPRIEEYLYAIFSVLYTARASISDARYFRLRDNPLQIAKRQKILSHTHELDDNRMLLEAVFKNQYLFEREFQPSIRRLSPFFKYLPKLFFGSTSGIDFKKLVSEKWIVLVNLDKTRVWGTPQQRVLGTLIINEIVNAVHDLNANGWKGKHYLYIDEVGQYATRVLHDLMAYRGKSGLWVTVSHQFFSQVEDKMVLEAIENLCKIKVMFSVGNTTDRQHMTRNMYTSELKEQAADSAIGIKKQHAVIKINKKPPVTMRVDDVITPEISRERLNAYKETLYKLKPEWYKSQESIRTEIINRFAVSTPPSQPLKRRPSTFGQNVQAPQPTGDSKPQAAHGVQGAKPDQGKDRTTSLPKQVLDDIANREALLRKKGRRTTGKGDEPPPEAR